MLDHAARVLAELDAGRSLALAVVIGVDGSAPHPVGTSMLVLPPVEYAARAAAASEPLDPWLAVGPREVVGNVSGGCVEADVVTRAMDALGLGAGSTADLPATCSYGWDADRAVSLGLTCGGVVGVAVVRLDPDLPADMRAAFAAAASGGAASLALVMHDGAAHLSTPARLGLGEPAPGARLVDLPDGGSALVVGRGAPPALLVYGATDVAGELAALGRRLGYRVSVCDPRAAFLRPERLPDADELVLARPVEHLRATPTDARTAVCVLSHDEGAEVPLLVEALGRDLGYVGALGSRRTHARRVALLRDAGVPTERLARLRGPIGLDLGGRTAAETALSILAEVVACAHGRGGGPLSLGAGAIHGELVRTH